MNRQNLIPYRRLSAISPYFFAISLWLVGQSAFAYPMDAPSESAHASPSPVAGSDDRRISEALQSADPDRRRDGVLDLAHAHVANPIGWLTHASQDPAPEVRLAAIRVAAGSFAALETAFIIQGALLDEDPIVRLGAAHAIQAYRHLVVFPTIHLIASLSEDAQVRRVVMLAHGPRVTSPSLMGGAGLGLTIDTRMGVGFSLYSPRQGSGSSSQSQSDHHEMNGETITEAPPIPESSAVISGDPVPRVPDLYDLHNSSKRILGRRRRQGYISSGIFNLARDYDAANEIIDEVKNRPRSEGLYQINYDFIAEDPFLYRHSQDLHQIYPRPVSDQEWLEMRDALKRYPEVAELGSGLDSIFRRANVGDGDSERERQNKEMIQKRIKKLFDSARQQEASGQSGRSAASPGGDLALRLFSNLDRCIDGLQSGLSDLEKEHFEEGEPESAGDLISRVFTNYKMEFIEKHGSLRPRSSEFRTTVVQNLRQRMLYSLGLRGAEAEVAYPDLGNPELAELKPKRVMARFLAGERTQLSGESAVVEFQAFNVDQMVRLLQSARESGFMNSEGNRPLHSEAVGIKLKSSLIQQIALADPILADAYTEFFTDPHQPNDYFAPAPAGEFMGNIRLKDRFWLHLLEANGYIQRP